MSNFNLLMDQIDDMKQRIPDQDYIDLMKTMSQLRKDLIDDRTLERLISITAHHGEISTVGERVRHLVQRLHDMPRMLETIYQLSAERLGLWETVSIEHT